MFFHSSHFFPFFDLYGCFSKINCMANEFCCLICFPVSLLCCSDLNSIICSRQFYGFPNSYSLFWLLLCVLRLCLRFSALKSARALRFLWLLPSAKLLLLRLLNSSRTISSNFTYRQHNIKFVSLYFLTLKKLK